MSVRDDLHDNKDLVIGATGAVVLTGLVILLFFVRGVAPGPATGGADGGGTGFYEVTFNEEDHQGMSWDETVTQGEPMEHNHTLSVANVTQFEATLTWTPDAVPNFEDRLSIEVTPPSGEVDCETPNPKDGTSGSLTITCDGVPVPAGLDRIAANSPQDARNRAARQIPAQRGATGTYIITVTLEDPGSEPTDDSQDYTLETLYRDYHAQAERTL